VLLVNTSAQCRLTAPANREFQFGCFSLSVEHLFPLFSTNEFCWLQSLCNTLLPGKWYPAATPLASACHRLVDEIPPSFDLEHRAQLLKVAAHLLSAEFEQAGPRPACIRANPHLANVLEKISANELIRVPVQELASRSCCSRRHFTRLFRQHYGRSVKAIKMDLRLAKAVCLLSDPNAKVTNVAEQCGFNHLGLFHQCFKRRFGSSPGQWRNLQASAQSVSNNFPTASSSCALRRHGLCPWNANHNKPHPANGTRSIDIKTVPKPAP
jgi:AraC-like DNA-binding protein